MTRSQLASVDEDEEIAEETAAAPSATPERKPLFRIPDVREDIRALPSIFRSRRLIWLPFIAVVIGFLLALVLYGLPPDLQSLAAVYIQFAFSPQGLFMYFIAGYLAPRASYLVGGLLGVLDGALYAIAIVATLPPDQPIPGDELARAAAGFVFQGAFLGILAGGFASWYRDMLQGMQQRNRQSRVNREVAERAKRREERQEARKLAKQRPT